jgi:hypothetical protein
MIYERTHLKAMHGYTPGLEPEPPVIKRNTNDNPYPPRSSDVDRAIQSSEGEDMIFAVASWSNWRGVR